MEIPFIRGAFSLLLDRLYPFAQENVKDIFHVKKEMEDMKKKMEEIHNTLEDAEERARRDKLIQHWLKELQAVMYKTEDLVDDYEHEIRRLGNAPFYKLDCCLVHWRSISCPKGWSINKYQPKKLTTYTDINKRIKKIHKKLDEVHKDWSQFDLKTNKENGNPRRLDRQTHRFAGKVIGEEVQKNKERLLKLIMKGNEGGKHISILAITGMGGVEKTTLAQIAYTEALSFDIKCWVSITENCDEETLLKRILENIDCDEVTVLKRTLENNDANNNKGMEPKEKLSENLVNSLNDVVFRQKFFMVLDDIWDVDILWYLLHGPLQHGAPDSKILITTRDVHIAKNMMPAYEIHEIHVNILHEHDALSLLYQNVFTNGSDDDNKEDKELVKHVALEIVKKCGYLPLAIKAIGAVLRQKGIEENKWKKVLENDLWELEAYKGNVMASIMLSYMELDPRHRQCFLYLSLFPNKYEFSKNEIIPFWIAEGLVEEEDKDDCYDVLVKHNLLDSHPKTYDHHVMHDIVHSFIRKLSNEQHVFGEDDVRVKLNARRHSISTAKTSVIPYNRDKVHKCKRLRSILLFNSPQVVQVPGKDIIERMRHLRVLSIEGTAVEMLPPYISKLVQLRLINLSGTLIKSLPESIGDLVNLQYLWLYKCEGLKQLPASLVKLRNLRCLGTNTAAIEHVPKGMGRLTNLETLGSYADIEELGPLTNLKFLHIQNLDGIDANRAEKANLKEKQKLYFLIFTWTIWKATCVSCASKNYDTEAMEMQAKVLEALCPPPCLETLHIAYFFGPKIPTWLSSSTHIALPNLKYLVLQCLHFVQQLPGLGALPNLQHLDIIHVSNVKSIGLEFFYSEGGCQSCRLPFRNLKQLKLLQMHALEECQQKIDVLPTCSCSSNSKSVVRTLFCRLEALVIEDCPKLISFWDCLSYLKAVSIKKCPSLEVIPELPAVELLIVGNCWSIEQAGPFPSLEKVVWEDSIGKIRSLPKWLGCLHSNDNSSSPLLKSLYMSIKDPYMMRRLDRRDIGLDWPFIRNIPTVQARVRYGSSSGDYFYHTKSPFLIERKSAGRLLYSDGDPVFSPVGMDFATSCCSSQSPTDAAIGMEVVPAVQADHFKKLGKVVPEYHMDYCRGGIRYTNLHARIPFNFHAHMTVMTVDGTSKLLCLHGFHSNAADFAFSRWTKSQGRLITHDHIPLTTSNSESGIACFSHQDTRMIGF